MDRFERRLHAELHGEFDSQAVDTPPPHRARYARLRVPVRRPPLRATALVTAVFAVGVLVGLVLTAQRAVTPGPGHSIGVVPPSVASTQDGGGVTTRPATTSPSARVSGRPAPRPRQSPESNASSPPPAFADDFAADPVGADPPAGWQVDDGRWTGVVDDGGHVVRHDAAQPLAHLAAGSPRWTDYSVGADVSTGLLELGFAGVAGRYQDPADDYECGLGAGGQLQLWVVQAGNRRLLASASLSLDLSTRHALALGMRGSQLTCSLDGSSPLHATDATYGAGRIALVASSGEAAEFGGVRVAG